jgi:hypothetical protein
MNNVIDQKSTLKTTKIEIDSLKEFFEDFKDLRDLREAVARNQYEPGMSWEEAKKELLFDL